MRYLIPIVCLATLAVFAGAKLATGGTAYAVMFWTSAFGTLLGTGLYALNRRREEKLRSRVQKGAIQ